MAKQDEEIDILKAISVLAFRAVEKRESSYVLRVVCRWYSREFNTPLAEVEEIPLETLLRHYFEVRYENMSEEDLVDEKKLLVETKAERLVRETKEKEETLADEEFYKLAQEEAAAAAAKNPKPPTSLDKKPEEDAPIMPVQALGSSLPTTFSEVAAGADSKLRSIPEGIRMEFAADGEFDDLDSWDLLGPPKKDK